MSTDGLRRSSRNAGKKEAAPPVAAPAPKKRATNEKKDSVAKKAKTAIKEATIAAKSVGGKKEPTAGLQEGEMLPADLPEVQTHDGKTVTLAGLLAEAKKGIIIFAYPKASTPGCTTQACLFRDSFSAFDTVGYTVYGLSGDSPAANTKFVEKQALTYTLLCDAKYELHEKLGIKKAPKGTIRSVTVIEKTGDGGKILKKTPASPKESLEIAKEAVGMEGVTAEKVDKETGAADEEAAKAEGIAA